MRIAPPRPQLVAGTGLRRRSLLLAGSAMVGACSFDTDRDHQSAQAPGIGPLPRPVRTAWVFSSGGPRGFVHVGVLKAADELGLRPDLIVGASAGALVGALYASGRTAREIEALALDLSPWQLARASVGGTERLSGTAIAELVREHSQVALLEDMPVMMAVAAQRLPDGQVLAFTRGDVGLAVQAASAIEGQFTPVRIRGTRYADADLRQPLPVRLARQLGAVRVLSVDASAHEDRAPESAARYRQGDLYKRSITRPDALAADLLLHPEFGYWVSLSREFRERAIAAGYRSAMASAAAWQALHRN